MPRWIAIRASAVVALVGSVLTLLFASLLALVLLGGARLGETGPLPPQVVRAILAVGVLVLAGLSVWGISTAAGIFQRRAWARVSMVILAGLLLLFGVTGAPTMLLFPTGYDSGAGGVEDLRRGMAGFYLMLAAIGAWWLILFNRQASRSYFVNGDAPNQRPLSITVIAVFLLGGAVASAVAAVVRAPFAFLGFSAGEWTAMACYTGAAALQIYLGSSLLQLNTAARCWSIAFFAAVAANTALVAALAPGGWTEAIAEAYERRFFREAPNLPDQWILAAVGIAIAVLPIWFLVRRRNAFQPAKPATR